MYSLFQTPIIKTSCGLILAVLMVFALTGCGQEGSPRSSRLKGLRRGPAKAQKRSDKKPSRSIARRPSRPASPEKNLTPKEQPQPQVSQKLQNTSEPIDIPDINEPETISQNDVSEVKDPQPDNMDIPDILIDEINEKETATATATEPDPELPVEVESTYETPERKQTKIKLVYADEIILAGVNPFLNWLPKKNVIVNNDDGQEDGVEFIDDPDNPNPIHSIAVVGVTYSPKRSTALLSRAGGGSSTVVKTGDLFPVSGRDFKVVSIRPDSVSVEEEGLPENSKTIIMPDIVGFSGDGVRGGLDDLEPEEPDLESLTRTRGGVGNLQDIVGKLIGN